MYKYEEIKRVHLGITSKCNANCPMCIRNVNGGPLNPNIKFDELSLEDIKKAMSPEFVRQLRYIYCCGNVGDPMLTKDLLPIMKYFKECSKDTGVCFHTNGSGRSEEWWKEMGAILNNSWDCVRFSIDGLGDTNHLYRRGTDFDKIIKSVKAFVKAGGNAIWEFIPFKHNQHQIDEARKMAEDLGMQQFQIIKSGRFALLDLNEGKKSFSWRNSHPVYSKDGTLEYLIEPPEEGYSSIARTVAKHTDVDHQFQEKINTIYKSNSDAYKFDNLNESSQVDDDLGDAKIECKAKRDKCIYISEQGYVFPCCWTQYQMYSMQLSIDVKQIRQMIYDFGFDNINIKNKSLKEIFESDWFDKFEKSWGLKSIKDGKLLACSRHCTSYSNVMDEYSIEADKFKNKRKDS